MENNFTNEQTEKVKDCKTEAEAKELAEKEEARLTDEDLKEVAGGELRHHEKNMGIFL